MATYWHKGSRADNRCPCPSLASHANPAAGSMERSTSPHMIHYPNHWNRGLLLGTTKVIGDHLGSRIRCHDNILLWVVYVLTEDSTMEYQHGLSHHHYFENCDEPDWQQRTCESSRPPRIVTHTIPCPPNDFSGTTTFHHDKFPEPW